MESEKGNRELQVNRFMVIKDGFRRSNEVEEFWLKIAIFAKRRKLFRFQKRTNSTHFKLHFALNVSEQLLE